MNPYNAYRQQEQATAWTMIDTVIALYDGAIERLDRAESALAAGDEVAATSNLARAQLLVMELASGVRLKVDEEAGTNMLRLYEYVTFELSQPWPGNIHNARKVLRTLREGFESVRVEAAEFERAGGIAGGASPSLVHATA